MPKKEKKTASAVKSERLIRDDGTVKFTTPVGGRGALNFLFRVPDLEDLAMVDLDLPLLPTQEDEEEAASKDATDGLHKILSDPKATVRFMKRANRMLVLTSVEPKVVEELGSVKDGAIHVRALSSNDRIFIFLVLTGLAGFTEEAAVQVRPFVEDENS